MEYIEVQKNINVVHFPHVLYTKRVVCDRKLARIWLAEKMVMLRHELRLSQSIKMCFFPIYYMQDSSY